MSQKNRDNYQRWRSRQTAFRLSEEEFAQLKMYVKLTGKSKQEYITDRVLNRDVVVQGKSPGVQSPPGNVGGGSHGASTD